jgi:DNA-binding response OmpR family regulator
VKTDKIVIIEDEEDILEVIAYNLKREGFDVTTSTSGEDGLSKIERATPNLVILDLMLPEIDGLDLCRKLKADPVTQGVPIIMVTAKGEESDVVLGLGMARTTTWSSRSAPRSSSRA